MDKTPQNRYSITAKGAAFLAAVDAGLVDGTETGVDKFEKFWRLWEQSAKQARQQPSQESAKDYAKKGAGCFFAVLLGSIIGSLLCKLCLFIF